MDARILKANDFRVEEDFRGSKTFGANLRNSVSKKVVPHLPRDFANLEFLSIR